MKNEEIREKVKHARNVRDVKAIAMICEDDEEGFEELIGCMEDKDFRISGTAAWAMSHAVQKKPDLITSAHQAKLIRLARQTTSGALKRNIARAWQWCFLPPDLMFDIAETALGFLNSAEEDVAVKAFSITVLERCLKVIPELKEEVLFILEKEMPHASAAYIHRAGKLIRAISRMAE